MKPVLLFEAMDLLHQALPDIRNRRTTKEIWELLKRYKSTGGTLTHELVDDNPSDNRGIHRRSSPKNN